MSKMEKIRVSSCCNREAIPSMIPAFPKPSQVRKPQEAVKVHPDGRQVCNLKTVAGKDEYDSRRYQMVRRQRFLCAICGLLKIFLFFDHEAGRGHNAAHRDDRLLHEDGRWKNAALCATCNSLKGSKRYHWCDGKYIPVDNRFR